MVEPETAHAAVTTFQRIMHAAHMYMHLAALSKANLKRKHAMRHRGCTLDSDAAGRQGEGGRGRADHTDGHCCWHLQVASQEGPHLQVSCTSFRQPAEFGKLWCGSRPSLLMPWQDAASHAMSCWHLAPAGWTARRGT